MARVTTDNQHYTDIAAAIRSKTGGTATYKPAEMAAAISGITGGGGDLNFEVVGGTTQPENPVENTVWVNTDEEITGWCFDVTEPENAEEGTVWIEVGTDSGNNFNALTENCIRLYPVGAMQYLSGAWVAKDAQIRQNGAWVSWRTYIYNAGDQYTIVTGGYKVVTSNSTNGSASLDADRITFKRGTSTQQAWTGVGTKNSIDLTGYNYLYFDMVVTTNYTSYGGTATVGVTKAVVTSGNGTNTFTASANPTADGERRTISVPIDAVSSGYVSMHGIMEAEIYAIWLGK